MAAKQKGIEYVLSVIDRATAPFKKMLANIAQVSKAYTGMNKKFETDSSKAASAIVANNEKISASYAKTNAAGSLSFKDKASRSIDKITGSINNAMHSAIGMQGKMNGIGIREKVANFSIKDFTTSKIHAINNQLQALKNKAIAIPIRVKDAATAKIRHIALTGKMVKDRIVHFSAKDFTASKVHAINNQLQALKNKAIAIPIRVKDAATAKIRHIALTGKMVKDRIVHFSAKDFISSKAQAVRLKIAGIKSKIVDFNVRDRASGAINKITGSANNAMKAIIGVKGQANSLSIRDTISPVFRRMGTEAQSLKSKAVAAFEAMRVKLRAVGNEAANAEIKTTGNSGIMRKFINSIGGPMVAGGLTLGAVFGAAISKGMENDLQKTNITTLMRGNVEAANALFKQLTNYSIKTPYEKSDIIEAQKTMMSFGLSSEYAFEKLRNMGDIAMGDANKMQSLSLAFSQATSAGKLQGQDLLQMINAGFNPLQVISERTGKSMASLRDRMEKGGISAKDLGQAFEWATDKQGLFYKGAEKSSQTFAGKLSNVKDAASEALIGIYEVIKPVLLPVLDKLIVWVEKIGHVFKLVFHIAVKATVWLWEKLQLIGGVFIKIWTKIQFGTPILIALTAIAGGLIIKMITMQAWAMIVAAKTAIWSAAQWALNGAIIANPIGLWIAVIIALIALIGVIIYKYDGWGAAWGNLINYLKAGWMEFKTGFDVVWIEIQAAFSNGINSLRAKWLQFKSIWNKDAAKEGLTEIDQQAKAWEEKLNAAKEKEKNYANQAKYYGSNIFNQIKDNGKDVLGDIKNVISKYAGGGTAEVYQKIKDPKTPKKDPDGAAGAGAGKAKKINEGGSRPTTINITIHKLQDQIVIHAGNVKEGAKQAAQDVVNELVMALNSVDAKGGLTYE